MMKTLISLLLFFTTCTTIISCKKSKITGDQLPPITQTGANTFGCLINGKLYIPKGFKQNKPNFDLTVDPTFQNGNFGISTFNLNDQIRLDFGSNDIKNTGIYKLEDFTKFLGVSVYFDNNNCYFGPTTTCILQGPCYVKGQLNITKYDLQNEIFSGTFEFKLYDPYTSCDTIFITEGRFDKKL